MSTKRLPKGTRTGKVKGVETKAEAARESIRHMIDETDSGELAGMIAAVLKHPDTPSVLYNAIADVIIDMESHIDHYSPEMVAKGLAAFEASEARRKGGDGK